VTDDSSISGRVAASPTPLTDEVAELPDHELMRHGRWLVRRTRQPDGRRITPADTADQVDTAPVPPPRRRDIRLDAPQIERCDADGDRPDRQMETR
jgi:hypothetical protein